MGTDTYLFINSAMIYWASLQGPKFGAGENQEGSLFQNKTYPVNSYKELFNGDKHAKSSGLRITSLEFQYELPLFIWTGVIYWALVPHL